VTGNEYQKLASRTNDGLASIRLQEKLDEYAYWAIDIGGVMNACLGLSGEVGELNDMIKKWVFHEKVLDETHLKKELGDVMWYVAMMCQSMGWDLDDVLQMNIDKLIARYPDGFDVIKANNRKVGDV
jgi:NTP pyrophosphatase (non-canonical NTP hydrolase)